MTLRRTSQPANRLMISEWREHILSRRSFLLRMAGGSLSVLMPMCNPAAQGHGAEPTGQHRWAVLEAVQSHLFPSEQSAPGAREIKALDYLRFVILDKGLDIEDRQFILRGVDWLEDLAQEDLAKSFLQLNDEEKERILTKIAASTAGGNWLSTIQLYICEALLSDPVYGGNPEGIGWKWLGHNPGFPRPTAHKRYGVG